METIATVTVDDLNNIELIQIPTSSTLDDNMILNDEKTPIDKHDIDDSIELQTDIESMGMDSIRILNEDANIQNLELIDCQIELMDQFNLTDHIELSNDAIQLQENDDYLGCDMPDIFNIYQNTVMIEDEFNASEAFVDSDKIGGNERRKVVSKSKKSSGVDLTAIEESSETMADVEVNENFTNWLDSVIETINMTMDYGGNGHPEPLFFRIPHVNHIEIFLLFLI